MGMPCILNIRPGGFDMQLNLAPDYILKNIRDNADDRLVVPGTDAHQHRPDLKIRYFKSFHFSPFRFSILKVLVSTKPGPGIEPGPAGTSRPGLEPQHCNGKNTLIG
jgi:hypothetical protein